MEKNNLKHQAENATPVNVYSKFFSDKENKIPDKKLMQEHIFEKEEVQELPALYYDEFHFASYE